MADDDEPGGMFWRLLWSAATKPLNIVVLCLLVAAAILTAPWVAAAILPVYGLLVAASARDPKEMDRLTGRGEERRAGPRRLDGISGTVRLRVVAALSTESAIRRELRSLPVVPQGVAEGVEQLCDDLVLVGRRATDVERYLATVDVPGLRARVAEYRELGRSSERAKAAADALAEQLAVVDDLDRRRADLEAEIAHVEAGLGAIRARIAQARVEAVAPSDLAGEVTGLRDRMRAMADGLSEAYGQRPGGELPAPPTGDGAPEPGAGTRGAG